MIRLGAFCLNVVPARSKPPEALARESYCIEHFYIIYILQLTSQHQDVRYVCTSK